MPWEFRKSISAILYQRVASPFYGTLIISWLVWNWQTWYVTLFVSEEKLEIDKLTFLTQHYNDVLPLLVWPLLSTIGILTVGQWISNGAYWLDEEFKQWRVKKRNSIQDKQQITIEESIELRTAIRNQNEEFQKLLKTKDDEIASYKEEVNGLNGQISMLQEELKQYEPPTSTKSTGPTIKGKIASLPVALRPEDIIYETLISNNNLKLAYSHDWITMRDTGELSFGVIREFILANDLAKQTSMGGYIPTDLGKKVYQLYYNKHSQ